MVAAPQADYLVGINVCRAIVITPFRAPRHKQAAELAKDVQQTPNVLLKSRALIATYRKIKPPELVFFLTRSARRVPPIHFAVLIQLPMDKIATTTATHLPQTELV